MKEAAVLTIQQVSFIKPDIEERIIEIMRNLFVVESYMIINEASLIDDLGVDSLDIYEMIMTLEREFHIRIPDGDAEKLVTVGSVVKYVERKLR